MGDQTDYQKVAMTKLGLSDGFRILPGKDAISKSMLPTLGYRSRTPKKFDVEAEGLNGREQGRGKIRPNPFLALQPKTKAHPLDVDT